MGTPPQLQGRSRGYMGGGSGRHQSGGLKWGAVMAASGEEARPSFVTPGRDTAVAWLHSMSPAVLSC